MEEISIRNVAIAGASGALGSQILQSIVDSGHFKVTVLTRESSEAQFPGSISVLRVNYNSVPDLTVALTGQDAVVSALTTAAMETQIPLIEAAIKAKVRRFLPSEFCADIGNPKAATLPVYQTKLQIHDFLRRKVQENPTFTYSLIRNGPFLDWSLDVGFFLNLKGGETPLYDGGDRPFSTTTLATVGQAVVGVLLHPEATRNRAVFVQDLVTTQNEILAIAQRFKPDQTWTPKYMSTDEMEKMALENYANGLFDLFSSLGFFCRSVFAEGYGGKFQQINNELLGIPPKTQADLQSLVEGTISRER